MPTQRKNETREDFLARRKQNYRRNMSKRRSDARAYYHSKGHGNHVLKTYGVTPEQYDDMAKTQGGRCAICQEQPTESRRLCVDHDHSTGQVRALLCVKCNTGIGHLNDDIRLVTAALEYLQKHTSDSETVEEVT